MNQNAEQLLPFEQPDSSQPYPVMEAIITEVKGSAPTRPGDSMLLLSNGRWVGSVGGGNLEWKLMQTGQMAWWRLQENGQLPPASTMHIDHGLGCHSDQCCGGRVTAHLVLIPKHLSALMNDHAHRIYDQDTEQRLILTGGFTVEQQALGSVKRWQPQLIKGLTHRLTWDQPTSFIRKAKNAPQLWIFGAGHIARALAPLANALDYRVSVFDGRSQWADPEAFPGDVSVRTSALPESIDQAETDTTVLIMTHSHKLDYQLLALMSEWDLGYLGVIGSKTKAVRFRHRLDNEGIDDQHIHMPIGLPYMGKEPMAVAVSCMAELLQLRQQSGVAA